MKECDKIQHISILIPTALFWKLMIMDFLGIFFPTRLGAPLKAKDFNLLLSASPRSSRVLYTQYLTHHRCLVHVGLRNECKTRNMKGQKEDIL